MKTLKEQVVDLIQGVGFPGDQIEEAARFLNEQVRRVRARECSLALGAFSPGDLVTVKPEHGSRRLPAGIVGKVQRLGQKNISVDFGVYRSWRVPAFWLQPAPSGSEFGKVDKLPPLLPPFPRRRRRQYQETPPEMA